MEYRSQGCCARTPVWKTTCPILFLAMLAGCATTHRDRAVTQVTDARRGQSAHEPDSVKDVARLAGESSASEADGTVLVSVQEEADRATAKSPAGAKPDHSKHPAAPPAQMDHEMHGAGPMHAAEARSLTLGELESLALSNNPTLTQAEAQIRAACGAAQQAGLYLNPVLGYSGQYDQVGSGRDENWNGGFIAQEFVTGGKLELSQQKWTQRVRIAETNYHAQRQRVLNDLHVAYFRTLAAEQLVAVQRELVSNGEDNLQTTREMLNLGQTGESSVLTAEVELQRDRLDLMQSEKEYLHAWRTLTSLAGTPELSPQPLAGTLAATDEPLGWDAALSQLLSNSPELHAAWQKIEHDRITVSREEAEPIPNVLVDVSTIHTPVTDTTQTTLNVGLPLPIFDRNQGTVEQAQADLSQSHAEARRLELELRNRLATQFRDYETSRQRMLEFDAAMLPKAKQAYDMLAKSYEERRAPWTEVLTAQRMYLSLRAEQIRNELTYRENDVAVRGLLLSGGLMSPPAPAAAGHIDAIAKPR
ncbi:MAG: TolC family protein [Planctomycetota bacterium]